MRQWWAVALLGLAACGGGGGSPSTALSPATTTARPTTTALTATPRQLASIIAQHDTDLRRDARSLTNCAIQWPCGLAERLGIETLYITTETLRLNLDGADNPSNRGYLGAYPAEVEKLTRDTMAAAAEVHSLTDGLGNCGTASGCAGRALLADSAARSLIRQLDAWRPYL